jgi:hypothetical protein
MLQDKIANEVVRLTFDFTDLIASMGLADTTLTSPTVSLTNSKGTPLVNQGQTVSGLKVFVLVAGGTPGAEYYCACTAGPFSDGEVRTLRDTMNVV